MVFQIYMQILAPFEESYKKNIAEQQKKAQATAHRPSGMPGAQFAPPPSLGRPGHGMPNMQQPGMRPPMNVNGAMSQPIPPTNGSPYNPMHNQHRPSSSQNPHQMSTPDSHIPMNSAMDIIPHTVDSNLLDQDIQGIKRKHEQPDGDMKRVRQKTGTLIPAAWSTFHDYVHIVNRSSRIPLCKCSYRIVCVFGVLKVVLDAIDAR
jgi:SWI/SNF chromatin-remodeling complex subunit SWI1